MSTMRYVACFSVFLFYLLLLSTFASILFIKYDTIRVSPFWSVCILHYGRFFSVFIRFSNLSVFYTYAFFFLIGRRIFPSSGLLLLLLLLFSSMFLFWFCSFSFLPLFCCCTVCCALRGRYIISCPSI